MSEGAKPLILVVDDMPEVGQTVRMWIEEAGFDVQVAVDANEALTMAKARPPDLAICDVVLPSMLGWELCLKLKALAKPRKLPVIMLTAKNTQHDELRSYESQADDHFVKPPDFAALMESVKRLLAANAKGAKA